MDSEFRPNPETNPEDITPSNNPKKYPIQHILRGSRKGIINTMHSLYAVGYAEIIEWTPLQPTGLPGEFITMMTKYITLG
ncbi:MAG: hypothetical protein F6K65_34945 [Moorea sp. SIO3C2]|nr:hypothetical protein [Moorena sp. SIO3C2]